MKKENILFIMGLLLAFTACKKEKMTVYSSPQFIQFANRIEDTIILSFFFYPNQDQVTVALPVKLTGFMPAEDLKYEIGTDATLTSASAQHYSLASEYVYRKGRTSDTARLVIKKAPDLNSKSFYLVVQMKGGSTVFPGQIEYQKRVIKINNIISRPSWWNTAMVTTYLGAYTDRKYSKFIEVVNVGDLSLFTVSEQRELMLQFKYYLIEMRDAGTPVLEEDGKDMLSTIPLIG